MDLPDLHKLFLLAATRVSESDIDRRMEARAVVTRFDFGHQASGWLIEAIQNLAALGLLVPYRRDGDEEDQFVQLTAPGIKKAEALQREGLRIFSRDEMNANRGQSSPHSDGSVFSDGSGYATQIPDDESRRLAQPLDKPIYDLPAPIAVSSSSWTGLQSRKERLIAVKALFPSSLYAVEAILSAENYGHNNGPPLDVDDSLWNDLRDLHSALGQVLKLADDGALDADRAPGLVNEIAIYSRRAAEGFKSDPLKYAVVSGIIAVGSFVWGAQFLGGAALAAAFEAKRERPKG